MSAVATGATVATFNPSESYTRDEMRRNVSLTRDAVRGCVARRIAVYARISKDRAGDGQGSHLGVKRQRKETAEYLERSDIHGAVTQYDDNDRSGWDPSVVRPGFDDLLADIRTGLYDVVVAWHVDRFSRQPEQIEHLWRACKDTGTELHTVMGGPIKSALELRLRSALAADESDLKSARLVTKHRQLAEAGRPPGGKRRFGYTKTMLPTEDHPRGIIESEALIVRELAERLIKGETLGVLSRELNARGVKTSLGSTWTPNAVSALMRNAYFAGLRTYHGQVVGEAMWEAILDRDTWDALQDVLNAPGRKWNVSTARKYLLPNLATCDACGAPVRVHKRMSTTGEYRWTYQCMTGRHVHRGMDEVDAIVVTAVLKRLAETDLSGVLVADVDRDELASIDGRLSALAERRREVMDDYGAGVITKADRTRALEANDRETAALNERAAAIRGTIRPARVLAGLTGADASREAWEALSLGRKREVIAHLVESIRIVGAAASGQRKFRPEHVKIRWHRPEVRQTSED